MPTQNEELHDLRSRVLAGENVSAEEYAQVVDACRKSRMASEHKAKTKRASKKALVDDTPIDFGALGAAIKGKSG